MKVNINWFKLKRKLLNNIVWILLVLAVAVVGGLEPSFFKPTILGNVLSQATVLGILSFAQAFAIMLGLIDLSLLPSPNPDSYPRISLTNRRFLY